jgi:hypothetical protein
MVELENDEDLVLVLRFASITQVNFGLPIPT